MHQLNQVLAFALITMFVLVRAVLPAQQQLRVVLALQVAVNEVGQQVFKDIGGVLQSSLQGRHDK